MGCKPTSCQPALRDPRFWPNGCKPYFVTGPCVLEMHPFPEYAAAPASGIDRSRLPEPAAQPDASFPAIEKAVLPNGLTILFARRTAVPVVDAALLVDAGYAADQGRLAGTARLAMDMLDEGARTRTALGISEELAGLGAQLSAGSNLDVSTVKLSALAARLEPALDVFAAVAHRASAVYLVDRPGSQQSIVFSGHLAPPNANPNEIAIQVLNNILGGDFTSRINLNLREDKHWTYGAGSFLWDARGQRPFIVHTSVQNDKTAEALREIRKEIVEIVGSRPPEPAEFEKARDNQVLQLSGVWETGAAVQNSISEIVRFGYPMDHFAGFAGRLRGVVLGDVAAAAAALLQPDNLVWVVVGDRSKIEEPLRALGWGEVRCLDTDGNAVP
jgi:predicted Zn-dependent peptidase